MSQNATARQPLSPLERVLADLEARFGGDITAWIRMPAHDGEFEDVPAELHAALREALERRGIGRLYSHQARAFRLAREGRHQVIVTPTASGKTLCYNLPVLDDLARNPDHKALYLFPTKALAQDQMAQLNELIRDAGLPIGVHTYDGDTPGDVRRKIRQQSGIILSNPDMLHAGILPHHPKWVELFQNLHYVVIDELHTYRGIFGSHVSNVFRRLRRVARFYDSRLQFIATSATIANPAELARALVGEEVALVDRSGAPRASKDLIFYNPPAVNPELGLRRSALASARRFATLFLQAGVQTLVFASSRVNVEVLLRYLKRAIHRHPAQPDRVRGYRGGYLPGRRREIEEKLRHREILGLVSTNALELGIDIGSLEVCILAGYPGSISSTWQQIGRSGRRHGHSAALLIARNLPLDQFMVQHPLYFLEQSPERGLIQPDNLQILVSHIKCAAFELPFRGGERFGGENLDEILDFLAEQGTLHRQGDVWNWTDESYPADSVSLRNIPEENFVVFDRTAGERAIAEVDFDSAPELIHEDAIYMCEGRQYLVERLDYEGRKAHVKPVEVDYYTEAITCSGLRVLRSDGRRAAGAAQVEHGEVHLAKKFPGFKKIRFYTSENLGFGKIHLPVHQLHTTAYWFSMGKKELAPLALSRDQTIRAFIGLSYAMQHVAALLLMSDVRDLGRSIGDRSTRWFALSTPEGLGFYSAAGEQDSVHPDQFDRFDPTIFLYDNYPGGVGFSEPLFQMHDRLLADAADLIRNCECPHGCPSCVGPITEVGAETKGLALALLTRLV